MTRLQDQMPVRPQSPTSRGGSALAADTGVAISAW